MGNQKDCIFTKEYANSVLELPQIDNEFYYLLEWIYEIGFFVSNGMGASILPYNELYAWAELTQNNPTPDDIKIMREMSNGFIFMTEEGKKRATLDPIKELEVKENGS